MSRRISTNVVSISRGRYTVRRVSPRRNSVALRARVPAAARGAQREAHARVTPAWVCIASLVAVTMWPSAAVLLAKLALRMFSG
jgi:hypothetical protein